MLQPDPPSAPTHLTPDQTEAAARFTLGAFAIILDDERRVLLCHRRDYDLWNLPGGGVQPGETPWEAAVREVNEEVGLQVAVDRLVGVYSKPEQAEVVFSFLCSIAGGALTTSDEADHVAYFAVHEIPSNTIPKQVERIYDALAAGAAAPALKTQTGPSSIARMKQGA